MTGSVTSWKEQEIAFEVGGRVQFIQERGTSLEGRWEKNGKVEIEGELLAELDDQPFRTSLAMSEAEVQVSKEQIGVVDAKLEEMLPANLRAAIAEQERAEADYQRYLQASKTNAVAEADLHRARTARDVTAAKVEQAEGSFAKTEAEKRSLEASLALAKERLEGARWQLERCDLYAPFTGEVADVFVEAGGFVQPGQAVAHLVMMDPIQVDIAVSAETLRKLQRYSEVQVTVPGLHEPVSARIYDLATVADSRTRTFRVSIIVRNQRRIGTLEPGDPDLALPRVKHVITPLNPAVGGGPWFVEARRSLTRDDEGWFVWASSDPLSAGDIDFARPVMTLRKVRVTPGERLVNYQGIYVLLDLTDAGDLQADSILPLDVPAGFAEGGRVLVAESGWLLQPGQIVSVFLGEGVPEPGLFVPMSAVLPLEDGVGRVFVVDDGRARPVNLDVRDREGPLVRVRALDPGDAKWVGLGAQVVKQAHFLREGEPVRVVRKREVRL